MQFLGYWLQKCIWKQTTGDAERGYDAHRCPEAKLNTQLDQW